MRIRLQYICLGFTAASLAGQPAYANPALNAAAGVNASDFRYTAFATGLNYPAGMQSLSDGSILVATSTPNGNGGLYNSTGSLLRFVDANHDGVADNPGGVPGAPGSGTVVYSGLPGTLTSLQQAGNVLIATSSGVNPSITFLKMSSPTSYTLLGTESFSFPAQSNGQGWEHTTYGAVVQPSANGGYNLYFNIGSQADNVTTPSATTVAASGMFGASLHGDSIYRVTLNSAGTSLSGATQVATGLRNAAGLAFQPGTGNLYFNDNGIDNGVNDPTYQNSGKQYGADTIHMITAGQLASAGQPGTTVPDFGFAHNPYLESDGSDAGDAVGVAPLQTFIATKGGAQSEGPNEIAFAPASFAGKLGSNGLFVTFHGGPYAGASNVQNPLVYYDPASNSYYHFIEGGQDGLGHIDGVMSTDNALFLSDLDSTGSFYDSSGAGTGTIYELIAVPEPLGVIGLPIVGALLTLRRRPYCVENRPQ